MPDQVTPQEPDQNSMIKMQSGVTADLTPVVGLRWGDNAAVLTTPEIRQHALSLLDSAAAAEMDSAILRWAIDTLGASEEQAGQMVGIIARARQQGFPSCTMNLGGESIRPDTARSRGMWLLENAGNTEVEAALGVFMLKELGQSTEQVDMAIQELRRIRGLSTDWDRAGLTQK